MEFRDILNEVTQFVVTVDHMGEKRADKHLDSESFSSKKEANKFKKKMIKKYDLIKHTGHIVNFSDHIELTTNYG
jgi:hypothetical protein